MRISLALGDDDDVNDDDDQDDDDDEDDEDDNHLDPRQQFARRRRDRGGRPVDYLGQGEDNGDEDGDGDCGNDNYVNYDNYYVNNDENFARGRPVNHLGKRKWGQG